VTRLRERGLSATQAALVGARQIGFTVLAITTSLMAVLIPLLFMPGVVGRMFREFSVTLAITVALSAVISLSVAAICTVLPSRSATVAAWWPSAPAWPA
jgi:multidrug efflux pump subunit AcrB